MSYISEVVGNIISKEYQNTEKTEKRGCFLTASF